MRDVRRYSSSGECDGGGEVSDLNERVRKLTFKDMGGFWWQLPMKVSPHCSAKFPSLLM